MKDGDIMKIDETKFFKNGELKDDKIIAALRQVADDYENGEIIEVKNTLIEIVYAIIDFEESEERR